MTDDLESKLARLGRRVEARASDTRRLLADAGHLDLAEALRERFGARLAHLKTATVELGRRPDWYGKTQPYNFDLKGHANDPANAVHRRTQGTPPRPDNQPYRGKTRPRKRAGRRSSAADRGSHPVKTWHDVQDDR